MDAGTTDNRSPAATSTKPCAAGELVFQGADLLAQRRLPHVQQRGGTGDMTFLGHRREVAELAQIHIGCISDLVVADI